MKTKAYKKLQLSYVHLEHVCHCVGHAVGAVKSAKSHFSPKNLLALDKYSWLCDLMLELQFWDIKTPYWNFAPKGSKLVKT